jgi:hypothetical protein
MSFELARRLLQGARLLTLARVDRRRRKERPVQNPLLEYSPEAEMFETENFEWAGEADFCVLRETEEMELASELLAIKDEQELDLFLGKLIRRVGRGLGKAIRSPTFKAIGGVLKGVAKAALPIAGRALGAFVGGPVGATIGGKLASIAGSALGLELEGLSQEDREFEAARRFVRFASQAVKNAAASDVADPIIAAQSATAAAARRFAPGLLNLRQMAPSLPACRAASGPWVRQGRNILVLDC